MYNVHRVEEQCIIKTGSLIRLSTSVTRFGEISPLWQNFTILWQISDSLFCIWQSLLSLLWKIWYIIGLILIVANGQILKNNLTIWSHCSCADDAAEADEANAVPNNFWTKFWRSFAFSQKSFFVTAGDRRMWASFCSLTSRSSGKYFCAPIITFFTQKNK